MATTNYKIDEFTLDTSKRELLHKENPVRLSSRAFDILHYLLERNGTVVTKDELLDAVWKDSFVEESNLAVHISAIRRVLKERKGETKYIKTISGRGYSFVSSVQEVGTAVARRESKVVLETEIEPKASLAVLPIVFEETGNENEYLANGITHSLINDLSKIDDLRVLSYSAVKGYKDSELELQEIGFLLDADKLFTGHIYKYDTKLAIVVELINASDKRCVWGNEYVFEADEIFKVKQDISKVIAHKLRLKLNKESARSEIDPEAQKLYYRGKFVLESRTTKKEPIEYLTSAIDFFKKAIEIEPRYALAHVGIGTANVSLHNLNLKGKVAYNAAKDALGMALEIDTELSETFVLKGSIEVMFDDSLQDAKRSFDRAIELNSNNPDAYHWKGLACMFLGEYAEAIELESIATGLDPTSLRFNGGMMRIFFYAAEFEKSITQIEELIEFDSKNPSWFLFLALNYAHLEQYELAMENMKKSQELGSGVEFSLNHAYIYGLFGKRREAEEIVDEVLTNCEPSSFDSRDIVAVYSALGEIEKALFHLNNAKDEKRNLTTMKYNLRYKNIASSKEFEKLLKL